MKKSINIQVTEEGNKYITIYEVRAIRIKDESVECVDRFLTKERAEEERQFCYDVYKDLYKCAWISEYFVWL